jgi:catechol 2,3-dioxygenase-like lactoylglutathione lyase family enzyme
MKFGYTIVYVSSVADALTFYKDAFGFEVRDGSVQPIPGEEALAQVRRLIEP